MPTKVVGEDCPLCGEVKIPNSNGVPMFPGNRTFADHYYYQCEGSPWPA